MKVRVTLDLDATDGEDALKNVEFFYQLHMGDPTLQLDETKIDIYRIQGEELR
jgi:hypothetical protein